MRLGWLLGILIGAILLALTGTAFADDGNEQGNGQQPSVTSAAATDVTARSAVLQAYVNPEGHNTIYFFEYGPPNTYGSASQLAWAGRSNSPLLVSTEVGALAPETTYHYRVVATNSKGTTRGADRTFTTLGDGNAPPTTGGGAQPSPTESPSGQPGDPAESGATPTGPRLGSSVTLEPADGVVRVRRPGSASFVALTAGSELPVGSEVDTRRGSVALSSALPSGGIQTGRFGGGRFVVRQGGGGTVDLYLRGRYCTRSNAASSAFSSTALKPRTLWGRDHGGRFRTHGRNSHATVRGTRWQVTDSCDGTLTRVTSGSVVVRDTVRNKSVVLEPGEHYLARPRR